MRIVEYAICFMMASCLAYSSILKVVVIFSSEISVDFQWTSRCCAPEDRTVRNDLCENLKFYGVAKSFYSLCTSIIFYCSILLRRVDLTF
jgi:hypothetical protein